MKRTEAVLTFTFSAILIFSVLSCRGKDQKEDRKEATKLRVWQTETDKGAVEELNKTIEEFKREYPQVEVELESVAWSSLSDKLSVAIQAGNEPDVAHLEPFMVGSLVGQNLLIPIDDVIEEIERTNGPIYKGVRDLQLFDGRRYGIAYAVGTTGWSYRKDYSDRLGLSAPKTWTEYIAFARAMQEASSTEANLTLLLPGGDPFFIDQLFAELVANNGGKLFDPETNRPLLTSGPVVEVFRFLKDLKPALDPGWQTQPYLDQFNRIARSEAGNVPVTYARAAKAIEATLAESGKSDLANPEHFAWLEQPVGPSFRGPSIATIDCEPFVIFRAAEERKGVDLAKSFLKTFYRKDRYLAFVNRVPMHLTPIFENMSSSPEYLDNPLIKKWGPWELHTRKFLSDPSRVRPILMPDVSQKGRQLRFLLEFQSSKILTQAVSDVIREERSVEEAARIAQERAERLVESLGFRQW
jgi:ABC-type glycerol-3-phosphate transport system substrate-binding protein